MDPVVYRAIADPSNVDVSVIVVNWNTRDLLRSCLDSVFRDLQRLRSEVIVVDNASTDGSLDGLETLFPNLLVIRNPDNVGFARANNIGIVRCRGRYVCLCNSDVVVHPGCFDRMIAYMDGHPEIAVTGPRLRNGDGTIQPSCRQFPSVRTALSAALSLHKIFPGREVFSGEHMLHFPHDRIRPVDALTGAFLLVRRSAIEEVGLLDERFFIYGEETDWCRRLRARGREIVFFPEAEVTHFGGGSSSREPVRFHSELFRSKLLYWRKHHGLPGQLVFAALTFVQQFARILASLPACLAGGEDRDRRRERVRGNLLVIACLLNPGNWKGVSRMRGDRLDTT